jgi:hypothetical protein
MFSIKSLIKMLSIKSLSHMISFKDSHKPMGRWRVEDCSKTLNRKIDLSNEDHCGPCGEYRKIKTMDISKPCTTNKSINDSVQLKKEMSDNFITLIIDDIKYITKK